MSDAWDVFTASLNAAELEQERCLKSGNREVVLEGLRSERFGTRRHGHMVFAHEVAAMRFRVAVDREAARVVEEFRFSDDQLAVALRALEAAEHARGGAESRSERLTGSNVRPSSNHSQGGLQSHASTKSGKAA